MALPKLELIELQYIDLWFSNLVDNINYDLGKIEDAVPALDTILTTIDTSPVQYLRNSLDNLVNSINEAFEQIDTRLRALEGVNNNGMD